MWRLYSTFFLFNDSASTAIYTLSLHDALPICRRRVFLVAGGDLAGKRSPTVDVPRGSASPQDRSEEHTSELQSHVNLVCRLLLEKKNTESLLQRQDSMNHPFS